MMWQVTNICPSLLCSNTGTWVATLVLLWYPISVTNGCSSINASTIVALGSVYWGILYIKAALDPKINQPPPFVSNIYLLLVLRFCSKANPLSQPYVTKAAIIIRQSTPNHFSISSVSVKRSITRVYFLYSPLKIVLGRPIYKLLLIEY